jgi:hypothetical protein
MAKLSAARRGALAMIWRNLARVDGSRTNDGRRRNYPPRFRPGIFGARDLGAKVELKLERIWNAPI